MSESSRARTAGASRGSRAPAYNGAVGRAAVTPTGLNRASCTPSPPSSTASQLAASQPMPGISDCGTSRSSTTGLPSARAMTIIRASRRPRSTAAGSVAWAHGEPGSRADASITTRSAPVASTTMSASCGSSG